MTFLRKLSSSILVILIATTNVSTVRSSRSNAIPTAFISNGSQNLQKQTQSRFMGNTMRLIPTTKGTPSTSSNKKNMRKGTELGMFLGSDGGILGVGAPEIAVTLLVGYFVLGPSDLYKLVKEIGKFIQNFRTLGAEASKSFESSMENQLELDELRKAQNELNSAFGFRRSINVDQTADAFTSVPSSEDANVAAATATAVGSSSSSSSSSEPGEEGKKKKRKKRRVKKKKAVVEEEPMMSGSGEIPDLDMSAAFRDEITQEIQKAPTATTTTPSESKLREERMDRLTNGQPTAPLSETNPDWFSASESDIASEVMGQQNEQPQITQPTAVDNNRFASQLSGDWNQQILDKGDELSPIGNIMDQIALLEDERNAATKRLEEEFRMRAEIDENFYREKREVLEVAAAEISTRAFASEYEDLSATATTPTVTDDKEKEKDIKKTDGKSSDVKMKAEDKNKNVGSTTS